MRRKVTALAIACVSVLALGGVAAGSAVAGPIFEPESGPGNFPVPFTSESGEGVLTAAPLPPVECEFDTNVGELTGPDTDWTIVTFHKCRAPGIGPCQSAGRPEGTIQTEELAGTLVWLDKAHTRFGILLSSEVGNVVAAFTCEAIPIQVTGSVIGEITSPGLEVSTGEFTLAVLAAGGVQEWTQVEEEGEAHTLTAHALGLEVPAQENTTDEIALEEEGGFLE